MRLHAALAVVAVTLACSRSGGEPPPERSAPPGAPDRPEASPTITVVARVSLAGVPVAGARVELADGRGDARHTAITDREGIAAIEDIDPGDVELWADRGALASPVARASARADGGVPVELALLPAARVDGRVSGGAARQVSLIPIDVDHAVRALDLDPAGRFAIEALPPGRWLVEVDAPGYHVPDGVVVTATAGGRQTLELPLTLAGTVTGVVVDARGAPVADATVVLRGDGALRRGQLDPALSGGARWIHPLAGSRQLPIRDSRRFGAARDGVRPAECGRGHCGIDIGVARGSAVHAASDGVIAFVAVQPRGKAGRYVAIDHPGGLRSFYMHLDEVGAELAVGQPVAAGDPIGTLGASGVIRSGPHLHFALSQEVAGRMWFLDPEPLLRYAVVLPEERTPGLAFVAARSRAPGSSRPASPTRFTTDSAGQFRIEGVPPGDYVAAAFAAELAPGTSVGFSVAPGAQIGGITVALRAGVVVHGEVRGGNGALAGAHVVAIEGSGESARTVARAVTDAGGRFQLRPLAGDVAISVSAPGHAAGWRELTLSPRAARQRADFELAPEAPVLPEAEAGRIRLVLRDGHTREPLRGTAIAARGPGGARARAVAKADGSLVLAGLVPGRWSLRARRGGYVTAEQVIDVSAGETIELPPFELGRGAIVAGVVRDDSGSRVPGAVVTAGDASTTTDEHGEFRLPDAPTGPVDITASEGGRAGSIQLELRPGDELVTLQIDID